MKTKNKHWMKRSIILLFVVLGTLFFGYVLVGCSQEKQYIIEIKCDDNTTVNNISICIEMKEEYARKTAERFARSWERKDFNEMYTFMIPELKDIKNETDFVLTMKYLEGNDSIVIRLDEVLEDTENVSYVYYTVTSSIFEAKAPAMRMEYENGKWKINALVKVFEFDLVPLIKEKRQNRQNVTENIELEIEQISSYLKSTANIAKRISEIFKNDELNDNKCRPIINSMKAVKQELIMLERLEHSYLEKNHHDYFKEFINTKQQILDEQFEDCETEEGFDYRPRQELEEQTIFWEKLILDESELLKVERDKMNKKLEEISVELSDEEILFDTRY